MRILNLCILFDALVLVPLSAHAVVIDTVLVGNAGNAADTQIMSDGTAGYGDVPYEYRIGKYEITNAQYTEFLNAVDPTGVNGLFLYVDGMSTSQHGGINFDAAAPSGLKYNVQLGRGNRPVIYVSWYDAVRFANWLHNGQGSGDTETGAYTLGPLFRAEPIDGKDITRNPGARWFLPSEDEWYKAAYHLNDGVTGNYGNFPTGSDTSPSAELPPGGTYSANYNNVVNSVSDVGAYPSSAGPYGTFDQAGNLSEWNEALLSHGAHFLQVTRGMRGGSWYAPAGDVPVDASLVLAASNRIHSECEGGGNAGCKGIAFGFRLASAPSVVPEPNTALLLSGVTVALLTRRKVSAIRGNSVDSTSNASRVESNWCERKHRIKLNGTVSHSARQSSSGRAASCQPAEACPR